ncbi:DUF4286 family protein [Mucilaginibacter arboris]|uniref:DUF4286 family protein n=1 Tax=Mucilaginibacter arboris TaxID=2682090 RepID=A0A7K1SV23_9SPHI|nr:DUF4286 family protein [Mucilaginibacter arboris]MVN21134.1 DUF4286 family protein [Mucilaginibacter arboris]
MFIYNITILIEESIEQEWLSWVKINFIQTVMETGFFQSYQMLQVTDSPNEGLTYCVQFRTNEISSLQSYQSLYAPQIESEQQLAFANQLVTFSSTMKIIDEQ